MTENKRWTGANGRMALSARAIVALGVWSLLIVLLATLTIGIGMVFLGGMVLLLATLVAVIVVDLWRHSGSGL